MAHAVHNFISWVEQRQISILAAVKAHASALQQGIFRQLSDRPMPALASSDTSQPLHPSQLLPMRPTGLDHQALEGFCTFFASQWAG